MDLDTDDLISTKLHNGSMATEDLLDYWYIKYNIPKWQIDYVKGELK